MRRSLIIAILIVSSCKSLSDPEKLHRTITGKWIIVAPDHDLENNNQEIIYSKIQDSIVELTALKLISFSEDGTFRQTDSLGKKGKWGVSPDKIVFVENGGKGFNNFSAHFNSYEDGTLKLTELVEAEDEKIRLTWSLKKVTGSNVSKLFDDNKNEWRKRPGQPETETQMKQRLSDMLTWYSNYYKLVTKEASFFVTTRVILPFRFYQHAIAIRPFDEQSFFAGLFYNREQAAKAWNFLKRTMSLKKLTFPTKKDFLEEYAEFMEMMAEEVVNL